ncbi:hypothetical protein KEM52_005864 [Ascosphaera acerosa]|nr:hypothetical protein KEM52_005864 [Ascosphaera acerosa]
MPPRRSRAPASSRGKQSRPGSRSNTAATGHGRSRTHSREADEDHSDSDDDRLMQDIANVVAGGAARRNGTSRRSASASASPEPLSSDDEEGQRRQQPGAHDDDSSDASPAVPYKRQRVDSFSSLSVISSSDLSDGGDIPAMALMSPKRESPPLPAVVESKGSPKQEEQLEEPPHEQGQEDQPIQGRQPRSPRRVQPAPVGESPDEADGKPEDDNTTSTPIRTSTMARKRVASASVHKGQQTASVQQSAAPKRGRWSENSLVTSANSPLVSADLIKLLALPEAWTCLTEAEKREILALLPETIHPDYVAHAHDPFLRYSNAWRDSVRQFQTDLALGRYTAKWQRDALEASRQRALGLFDDFKEQQFEEFWGQKQKLDRSLVAGESSKIRLDVLVRAGVVKVGDVWKYARFIKREKHGRDAEEVFLEKECIVTAVKPDGSLDFLLPPDRRVFLTQEAKDGVMAAVQSQQEASPADKSQPQAEADHGPDQPTGTTQDGGGGSDSKDGDPDEDEASTRRVRPRRAAAVKARSSGFAGLDSSPSPSAAAAAAAAGHPASKARAEAVTCHVTDDGNVVVANVTTPNQLGNRIIEMDGRIENPPNGNAWKDYRCYRNNQDMGSLWEVRHLWYTRTH